MVIVHVSVGLLEVALMSLLLLYCKKKQYNYKFLFDSDVFPIQNTRVKSLTNTVFILKLKFFFGNEISYFIKNILRILDGGEDYYCIINGNEI